MCAVRVAKGRRLLVVRVLFDGMLLRARQRSSAERSIGDDFDWHAGAGVGEPLPAGGGALDATSAVLALLYGNVGSGVKNPYTSLVHPGRFGISEKANQFCLLTG